MRTRVVVLQRGAQQQGTSRGSALPGAVLHDLDDLPGLPERVGPGNPVLVLAEQVDAGLLGRACALLAATVDVPVASRALPHGPLAVWSLATAVVGLELTPGASVVALDELASTTWSGAWVPSVAKLASPAPSTGQHARSWVPGGRGFLVEHHPRPRVRPVGRTAPQRSPGEGLRPALLVAGGGAPEAALEQAQLLASARSRTAVAVGPGVAARYGTPSAVELVALPEAVPTASPGGAPCQGCGLGVVAGACAYCHRVVSDLARASAT